MNTKLAAACGLLAVSLCASAQTRPPVQYDAGQIQAYADRLNKLRGTSWQDGFSLGQELADLPSPIGYQILRDNWNKGSSLETRKQIFKGFVFAGHPDTLLVLNLGMHDPHLSMQAWTMSYLKDIAYVDFADDFGSYAVWYDKVKDLSVEEAKKRSLVEALDKLVTLSGTELEMSAGSLANIQWTVPSAFVPRVPALVRKLVEEPEGKDGALSLAAKLLNADGLDEGFRSKTALAIVERAVAIPNSRAASLLGGAILSKIADKLMPILSDGLRKSPAAYYGLLRPFLDSEDPRALPFLIDLMPNLSGDAARIVRGEVASYVGLNYSAAENDVAWWKRWYDANRNRFAMTFDESALPSFSIDAVPTLEYIPDADDVKQIPSKAFLVDNDPRKRYFVSGKIESSKPRKVLVVLPGGSGDPNFHPFVKRIQMNCLGDDWLVVQPIAPKWDDNPNRVVWPSVGVPYAPATFTMEQFLDGALDDLARKQKAAIKGIYLLGWSSGGPAVYSYAAHGRHRVDGAFVAMSIFQPELFRGVKSLHAKRFYILHSPQDFIAMSNPQRAEATLKAMGVPVKLQTYAGGHGWQGPVYDMLGEGFAYLTARK